MVRPIGPAAPLSERKSSLLPRLTAILVLMGTLIGVLGILSLFVGVSAISPLEILRGDIGEARKT